MLIFCVFICKFSDAERAVVISSAIAAALKGIIIRDIESLGHPAIFTR